MSQLWKYYWNNDLDAFRGLLAPTAGHNTSNASRIISTGRGARGAGGSSVALGMWPRALKPRRAQQALDKHEINSRDHAGLTLMLRAASTPGRLLFVLALLEHDAIDLYAQDPESGWNALHRALYSGQASVARALLQKERDMVKGSVLVQKGGQLIKTKDHEGHSPFELYNLTIGERAPGLLTNEKESDDGSDSTEGSDVREATRRMASKGAHTLMDGDELFAFGSNKNFTLGVGDGDDRQFPERVFLKRPEHLLHRFHNEYLERGGGIDERSGLDLSKIPALILHRPLSIRDVILSKLHSAVVTSDPVSNLYMCGVGRGGRLGLGDENTRFNYTPVQGGLADKRVATVALGQNHSMALTDAGEVWTWGSNAHGQLGYLLPPLRQGEEPTSLVPRQVFASLKKETIIGIAASSIHSVAHTGTSLFCWGKNKGQLALMDADSRSLEMQQTPRKVAPSLISGEIKMVSAIDRATTILLENHSVYVFTAYGYVKLSFPEIIPAHVFENYFTPRARDNGGRHRIQYITSGGDSIFAVTWGGDLWTAGLVHELDVNQAASTTNPSKIKGAVAQPRCIWNGRKDGVRSVSVGEKGSVIFATQTGVAWRRVKRPQSNDAYVAGDLKRKDDKFQRVPGLTRVATVRASQFGALAAIRKDSDLMKERIKIEAQTLWADIAPLGCLQGFKTSSTSKDRKEVLKYRNDILAMQQLGPVAYEILKSPDLESDLRHHLCAWQHNHEVPQTFLCTSSSAHIRLPVHRWLLAARSPVLRAAFVRSRFERFEHADGVLAIEISNGGNLITFRGADILSLLNVIFFLYQDKVIPAWQYTSQAPSLAYRYRQVRTEVMKVAALLELPNLEASARFQTAPNPCMDRDFRVAIEDAAFFEESDLVLELDDDAEAPVHKTIFCQRCPFFRALFHGRSQGGWLAHRLEPRVDLKHFEADPMQYVLKFVYGDYGAELFDSAVTDTFDDFIDLVKDVLSIADYLMLDRLSQICQYVLGTAVNTRNISHLLNEVSPYLVTEFKNAGLEYICLQLEHQLENYLLDDLDEELLEDLDVTVQANQLVQMPFARSGRAEYLLQEKYPFLADEAADERKRRVREMAFKATLRDDEKKLSSSFKGRHGVLNNVPACKPSGDKRRRLSRTRKNEPFSPQLRPRESQSHADLIFDMDEEDKSAIGSPLATPLKATPRVGEPDEAFSLAGGNPRLSSGGLSSCAQPQTAPSPISLPRRAKFSSLTSHSSTSSPPTLQQPGKTWGSSALPTAKIDLRDIIKSEDARRSELSLGLAAQKSQEAGASKPAQTKVSQKERKRQQQLEAQAALAVSNIKAPDKAWKTASKDASPASAPWKLDSANSKKPSLNDLLSDSPQPCAVVANKPLLMADVGSSSSFSRRAAPPDTRFPGQARTPTSAPSVKQSPQPGGGFGKQNSASPRGDAIAEKSFVPYSKLYITPQAKSESILGLGLADIIGQQRREQELVREAVAKRSLQEIQTEQEFQQWWDLESRRVQEEEALRMQKEREREEGGKGKGKERRPRGGREGSFRGGGAGSSGQDGGSARQLDAGTRTPNTRPVHIGSSRGGKEWGRHRE